MPHNRTRHVKASLRKQFVEVVAGNPPGDLREPRPDQRSILVADFPQFRIDFSTAAALTHDRLQLLVARRAPHRKARAVVGCQYVELFHVIDGLPAEQGVRSARIIADHSADGASAVSGRVRREGQLVDLGAVAQSIQNHARLNARESPLRINVQNAIHVLGEIEHHGNVAALAGEARAGAPRGSTGALNFRHAATAAITSSASCGTTKPIGICR